MAEILLSLPGDRHGFIIIRGRGRKLRILETDSEFQTARCFSISRTQLRLILDSPESERYEAAARIFHERRMTKEARRNSRETGGDHDQLVSASR